MALLIPIVVEQLLNSLMGMVDTMMVSNVGSEAISAVSLVDSMNNLVIQIFLPWRQGPPSSVPSIWEVRTGKAVTGQQNRCY